MICSMLLLNFILITFTLSGADEVTNGATTELREVIGTPVNIEEVKFYLHTSQDIGYPNRTINPFKPYDVAKTNGKIYFLNHGWTQSRATTPWFRPLTELLLKRYPDSHVVQVDWKKPAAEDYASAAFSTESVGNIIGNFINKLVNKCNVPLKNIVLIGHSLGAHVSGWVGKRYYALNHQKLPIIIALDPAGPLFSQRPEEKRLNRNDSDVVMVVHTNAGKLGIVGPSGTIDFYPNGGSNQPGCSEVDSKEVSTSDNTVWCPHQRAYNLFVEAVKYPNKFLAKKCKNYDYFEENECEHVEVSLGDLKTTEKGLFYLNTSGTPPFFKTADENSHRTNSKKASKVEHSFREYLMNNYSSKEKKKHD